MKVPASVAQLFSFNRIFTFNSKTDQSDMRSRLTDNTLLHSNIYIEAIVRWKTLLKHNPQSEIALLHLAENHLNSGDFNATENYLSKLEFLPNRSIDDQLFLLNANKFLLFGENKTAITYWKMAVANGMNNDHSMFKIANQFLSANDVESARACLNACTDEVVQSEFGQLMRAKCYIHELQWSKAIVILENLDKFKKRRKLAADLLYRCYISDFRHNSAVALCENLQISEHPDKHYLLGKAQYKQHRFADAIANFNNAIGISKHADSNVWLIKTLYAISEYDSAVAKAELFEKIGDVDFITQGRCWEAAGMISTAELHYNRAANENKDTSSWLALVKFHHTYRRWGRAYTAIVDAEKQRATNSEMQAIKQQLKRAFIASNTTVPKFRHRLSNFEFQSSEVMISSIVNRLLKHKHVLRSNHISNPARKSSRIALIINSLGPGGAERQAVNLANGLVHDSNDEIFLECTYLSRQDQDCFYLSQVDDKVTVREYYDRSQMLSPYEFPELANYADLIEHIQPASRQQLILHMAKRMIEAKPDVVHGWLDETFINTALVGSMLGIRNIVGRWGSMPPGVNRTITEREQSNIEYLQHAYREIARLPNLCYSSNSRSTGDSYAELMGINPDQVNIIYNGIDEEKLFRDAANTIDLREELEIPDSAIVVGTVFRISEEKRPMLWIDVARHLLEDHPDMHFVIVGAGPLECQLADYVVKHKVTNIHLVGRQNNVGAWFKLFDVLLMTSRVEGVSNSVIEAQFTGCPVVVPNVGGLSEAMEHERTGYLLDDDSAEAFANAVISMVKDSDNLNYIGNNARSFARQKFSIPTMVANYRELFGDDEYLLSDCA